MFRIFDLDFSIQMENWETRDLLLRPDSITEAKIFIEISVHVPRGRLSLWHVPITSHCLLWPGPWWISALTTPTNSIIVMWPFVGHDRLVNDCTDGPTVTVSSLKRQKLEELVSLQFVPENPATSRYTMVDFRRWGKSSRKLSFSSQHRAWKSLNNKHTLLVP